MPFVNRRRRGALRRELGPRLQALVPRAEGLQGRRRTRRALPGAHRDGHAEGQGPDCRIARVERSRLRRGFPQPTQPAVRGHTSREHAARGRRRHRGWGRRRHRDRGRRRYRGCRAGAPRGDGEGDQGTRSRVRRRGLRPDPSRVRTTRGGASGSGARLRGVPRGT